MSYGKITVGYGTPEQHDLNIVDFITCGFADNRTIHVSKIEDGTYTITVENLPSSGRAAQQSMRLSEESFIGILCALFMYGQVKGFNFEEMAKTAIGKDALHYSFSDNLTPPKP